MSTCQVDGCGSPVAGAVTLHPADLNQEGFVEQDTSPFEFMVCLRHARMITEGDTKGISMSSKIKSEK